MTIITTPFPNLSADTNLEIFFEMSPMELATCSQVSKSWEKWSKKDELWGQFPGIADYATVDIKKYIDSRAVTSLSAIYKKFAEFVSCVSAEGAFECVFLCNSNYKFSYKFGYGKGDLKTSTYFFMGKRSSESLVKGGGGHRQPRTEFFEPYYTKQEFSFCSTDLEVNSLMNRIDIALWNRIDELKNMDIRYQLYCGATFAAMAYFQG